jgi:dephospho-CoA kinase
MLITICMDKVVIGITGVMGSGKSSAAAILKKSIGKQAIVLDADKIAQRFLKKGSNEAKMIADFFPQSVTKGNIDPKKLADIVFENNDKLSFLNSLVHPFVLRAIRQKIGDLNEKVIIIDVPLLIEAKMTSICNFIVIIEASEKEIAKRSKFTKKELRRRSALQMTSHEKTENAIKSIGKENVFIVNNSQSKGELKKEMNLIWQQIRKEKK